MSRDRVPCSVECHCEGGHDYGEDPDGKATKACQESPITGHSCFLGPMCDLWHRTDSVSITCGSCGVDAWFGSQPVQTQLEIEGTLARLERAKRRKDEAYSERNQVVAALAKCFPACRTRTSIEGWDEGWQNCVYIELPTGQVSWHFHDRDAHLFEFLEEREVVWDGHNREEKYRRVAALEPRR